MGADWSNLIGVEIEDLLQRGFHGSYLRMGRLSKTDFFHVSNETKRSALGAEILFAHRKEKKRQPKLFYFWK
jgi:hypothetical protein